MRYLGLILCLIALPTLIYLMRSKPLKVARIATVTLGVAPFIFGWLHLNVAIIPWPYWPGYVKGMTIALPDLIAVAIIVSFKRVGNHQFVIVLFTCYLIASLLAVWQSTVTVASSFYVWQLLRMLIVVLAVARIGGRQHGVEWLVYGLCIGAIIECIFSLQARLIYGIVQARGTMVHQNLLGMMMYAALLLPVSLTLAGNRHPLLKVGAIAALITLALTGSRAAVAFAATGAGLLILGSVLLRPNGRTFAVAGMVLVASLLAAPIVYRTFAERYATQTYEGTDGEREAFKEAARAMWTDHPMGVGANQYVNVANTAGYSERAGVSWAQGSRSTNVHNVYLLVAAETGWPGIATFIVLLIGSIATAIKTAVSPKFQHGMLAMGCAATICAIAAHGQYEWIFVTEPMQYLFAMLLGVIVGLQDKQGVIQRRRVRSSRSEDLESAQIDKAVAG